MKEMNRFEKIRQATKDRNLTHEVTFFISETESIKVDVQLPTPYETQTIIFDSVDKSMEDDKMKAGGKMITKALGWMNSNMPEEDGIKLELNDLCQEEYDKLVNRLQDLFFRTEKKPLGKRSKKSSKI